MSIPILALLDVVNEVPKLSPQLTHAQDSLFEMTEINATAAYSMFSGVTLSGVVSDVGTLGALLAVPVAIVAAFWGVGKVTGMFKRFIR